MSEFDKLMKIFLHQNDLPDELSFEKSIAIDTETMGLKTSRDRLCLIQISQGNNETHLIKIDNNGNFIWAKVI